MIIRAFIIAAMTLLPVQAMAMKVCFESSEYAPWIFGNGTSPLAKRHGALIDFVARGADAVEIPIEFVRLPWKRCLARVRSNEIDGAMVSVYVPERESFVRYPGAPGAPDSSLRLWRVDYPVFARQDRDWTFDGNRFARKNLLIGAPLGYAAHKYLADHGIESTSDYDPHAGLKLTEKGRLNGYVVERRIGESILAKWGLKEMSATRAPLFQADWYLVLSHSFHDADPERALTLWKAAARVSKEYGDSILQEYHQASAASR